MRIKKQGMDLEILSMQQVARILKGLPEQPRQRVANWVASQPWADEETGGPLPHEAE